MRKSTAVCWGSFVLAGLLFFGPATFSRSGTQGVTPEAKTAYLAALRDASVSEPNEISRNLLAIVPFEDPVNTALLKGGSLVWEGEPGRSRLLVAAFMSRDSYDRYYRANLEAGLSEYTLTKSLWVTVVPELRNFFWGEGLTPIWTAIPTPGRVKQILGLHPAYDYDVILELFADPADLFRPSPDPEISDHEAELAYPGNGGEAWIFPRDANPFLALRTDVYFKDSAWTQALTYNEWFSARADTIYAIGDENDPWSWGWPWTRLGYTYDWGNSIDHVGLSEFVLRIDPNRNGGEAVVRLVRAVDTASLEWVQYFAGKN
ncbi:MAG: hypothetical protein JW843_02310 [Candidatus Aminicenantes bacterium]|nr:hypothetical protein [Candidatus Aminicenantes bacterium]